MNNFVVVWFKLYLLVVPRDSIDNKLVLVQVMAWCQLCHKPFPESML